MKQKLKPGDTVRVVGERGTAKIRAILTSMHGALLEKQIDGFRRWEPRRTTISEAQQTEMTRRRGLCLSPWATERPGCPV